MENTTVLDCTHSAAKRATNLHTFTLHGFCYPVRLPLPLISFLSHAHTSQYGRAVELGWASVSMVAGGRFISSAGTPRRPFSLVDCQLNPDHRGSKSRGKNHRFAVSFISLRQRKVFLRSRLIARQTRETLTIDGKYAAVRFPETQTRRVYCTTRSNNVHIAVLYDDHNSRTNSPESGSET